MRLRLKEDPREWRKFAWVLSVVVVALTALFLWRHPESRLGPGVTLMLALLVFVTGTVQPRWFRPIYRGAMTGAHYAGQFFGRVLLAVIFVVLITPLSLLLRGIGKDLLHLRRPSQGSEQEEGTYWRPVRPPGPLDRLF
jgi:hypothetical protein